MIAEAPDGVCLVLDGTGFVVLDCDGPREQALHLLGETGISIPDGCPRVVTGRDRDHYYFSAERPVGRHVAVIRNDSVTIDVLGAGVVVAPPSVHPDTGQRYRWQPRFSSERTCHLSLIGCTTSSTQRVVRSRRN